MRIFAAHENEQMPQHWSPQMKCDCCRLQRQRFGKQRHLRWWPARDGQSVPLHWCFFGCTWYEYTVYIYIYLFIVIISNIIYICLFTYIYMFIYIILYHNKKIQFTLRSVGFIALTIQNRLTVWGFHPHSVIISLGQCQSRWETP